MENQGINLFVSHGIAKRMAEEDFEKINSYSFKERKKSLENKKLFLSSNNFIEIFDTYLFSQFPKIKEDYISISLFKINEELKKIQEEFYIHIRSFESEIVDSIIESLNLPNEIIFIILNFIKNQNL